jgi:membrane protein YdbS with pleckstrin-like domain
MSQIYCSNCGLLIASKSNFCLRCGAPQHGHEAAAFHANDPMVENPQTVTNIPKQARRSGVEYIPKKHLGADSLLYFVITNIIKSFVLLLLIVVGAVLMPQPFAGVLVAYLVFVVLIALLTYNNFTYEIDKDGLTIEQGVIYKKLVSLPYEQIQNVNIERTVLDRLLGLSRISIETAGAAAAGNGAKVRAEAVIPALHLDYAKKVHDLLIDGVDGVHND